MSGNRNLLLSAALAGFLILAAFSSPHAQAAVKDSAMDGLTDQAETGTYHTDPNNYDTDGDGASDGEEAINGTDPLDPQSNPFPSAQKASAQGGSMAWYIGRSAGILAFILFSIVVINGLLITTRLVFKLLPPALNYQLHTFLAWLGFFTVMLHVAALTFDTYFKLRWAEILVPFSVQRSFLSATGFSFTWTLGIGTLALYGLVMLIASSELKNRIISVKAWRALHYASFLTYLLFLVHGIFSGTDTKTWWMAWIYSVSAALVFCLTVLRISISIKKRSAKTIGAL